MNGVNLKWPREQAARFRHELNIIMFGILCSLLGAVCMLFIMQMNSVNSIKAQAHKMEQDLNRCADMLHQYTEDRQAIMQQFSDMESRFTRMEHLMHIPRAERYGAWQEMQGEQ